MKIVIGVLIGVACARGALAGPAMVSPPADWTPSRDGAGTMNVETVAKTSVLRGIGSDRLAQNDIALEAGKKYVASVRVRGVGTTAASKAQLYVVHSSGGKKKKHAAANFDAAGDEWQVLRIEFDAQDEAPLASFELSWNVADGDKQGSFLFADATLASEGGKNALKNPGFKKAGKKHASKSWFKLALPQAAKPPKNGEFVVNGSFEATFDGRGLVLGTKHWDYWAVYHKAGKIALADADCHGGKACVRMQVLRCTDARKCGREETALLSQNVRIRPGKIYRLAAWVRSPDTLPSLEPSIASHPGSVRLRLSPSGKSAELRVPREATAWQQLTAEVVAAPRDYDAVLEVDGYVTVDDISVREIPALTQPPPAPPPAPTEPAPAPAPAP